MRLYVSASRIEQFRKVMTEEWGDEQEFIRSFTHPEPLGWQALYGEALGACIADPSRWRQADGSYLWTSRDGQAVKWDGAIVNPCVNSWPQGCVFEKKANSYWTTVSGDQLEVGGRTDAACGRVIVEGKARFGQAKPSEWVESLQWRFYLAAHPWAWCVEYRIHEIGGMYSDKKTGGLRIAGPRWTCLCETESGALHRRYKQPEGDDCEDCRAEYEHDPGGPRLEDIHAFRVWRQEGLEDELRRWVEEFVAWAKSRGLTGYLKPWAERQAA